MQYTTKNRSFNDTKLHKAARKGDLDRVKHFIENDKMDPNIRGHI